MIYVGVGGYKRCGKDTFTKLLIEELKKQNIDARRRSLADTLKEECAEMIITELRKTARKFWGKYTVVIPTKEELLSKMHSDEYKEQFRLLLQWWGTEFKRRMVDDAYWIDMVKEWADASTADVVVVSDVRFQNEIDFIKNNEGFRVWVYRDGCEPSEHASENSIDINTGWNLTVENNATIDELVNSVKFVALHINNPDIDK